MFKWLRKWTRNYFGFSKTETNGFIVLIPLMIFFLFAPSLYSKLFLAKYENYEADKKLLDSIMIMWDENARPRESVAKTRLENPEHPILLQNFDPNTASKDLLLSVGIPSFLTQRILNYRGKNGIFRVKADLSRIYDFPDSLFKSLRPYITLPEKLPPKEFPKPITVRTDGDVKAASSNSKVEALELVKIDINDADTTLFKTLRGIGPSYANRIVKYRRILGGFTSSDQLKEVYGLSDSLLSTFQDRLVVDPSFIPRKLDINLATFKELNAHPYISYKQAGELLNAKSKNGKFEKPSDLSRVASFSEMAIKKLIPYISFK